MHDFTNLVWPETPFGANQRPFGTKAHMLAGFGIEWDAGALAEGQRLPLCVSTVYLRVTPARPLPVTTETLPLGFRATVASGPDDLDALVDVLDRALVRAHRHATIVAGRALGPELGHIVALADRSLPGVQCVRRAWAARTRRRGMARMVDTYQDPDEPDFDVDADLAQPCNRDHGETARLALEHCLAGTMTAAVRRRLVSPDGAFSIPEAVAHAGWDVLGLDSQAEPS